MSGGNSYVKQSLLQEYGYYCWFCRQKFEREYLTLHHIIPKANNGETSIKNGMILCKHCHFDIVNKVRYDTVEYWWIIKRARKTARRIKSVRFKGKDIRHAYQPSTILTANLELTEV